MIEKLIDNLYGISISSIEKSSVGAGSDTYFIKDSSSNKYVIKFPSQSSMNNPDIEPEVCEYLLKKGLPVCEFISNKNGEYISLDENNNKFHIQKFVEGKMYDLNTAPDWLLKQQAQILGKIHNALSDYNGLGVGIGKQFFEFMTPQRALNSYTHTIEIAEKNKDTSIIDDLKYRIGLMKRFPTYNIDVTKLTCKCTHGDYFISQLICGNDKINAVIDWTTACIHPVVWEVIRSYVYASPKCKQGQIDTDEFILYVKNYLEYGSLNQYDIEMLAKLFYYQIAVCDYYNQYYQSTADNRYIYLNQAIFSTKLIKWFDKNIDILTKRLMDGLNKSLNHIVR